MGLATRAKKCIHCAIVAGGVFLLQASEHHGTIEFGGLPVPGVAVTVTQGDKKLSAITDQQGIYSFPDLPDGTWTIQADMVGFSLVKQDVTITSDSPIPPIELKMLPLSEIRAQAQAPAAPVPSAPTPTAESGGKNTTPRNSKSGVPGSPTNTATPFQRSELNATSNASNAVATAGDAAVPAGDTFGNASAADLSERASDGFLINGTANNGASSPFSQSAAFGNNRRGPASLYNGNIGFTIDNAALDARPFSLTGQDTPKLAYNHLTAMVSFGGPLRIPYLFQNGPNFVINYQWTRNRNDNTLSGLMPTQAERNGDFSQVLNPLGQPVQIFNPATGALFPGNMIPASQISPQAKALLNLYPLPNFDGGARYNYQIAALGATHQDSLQSRFNKAINRQNFIYGNFAFQSTRTDTPNLFDFLDTTDTIGYNTGINWRHSFSPRFAMTFGYQYSRQSVRSTPFFANRENVSGNAGISGNNQDPLNWGPPTLSFASGISGLSDAQQSFNRSQTSGVSYSTFWNRGRHNITFGTDFRRQEFNYFGQQNPRGAFAFTGAETQAIANGLPVTGTGFDFADFLLGVPDTSSIAFGNADKYFRESVYDAYVTDDWRISSDFTLNAGMRWEYGAPITELYGRLVNLDIAPRFTAVAPVVGNDPIGSVTGQTYPDSLVRPDKHGFEPRVGLAWRPFAASSMIVRAGYGVYYNTSVYQNIAVQMSQQYPLSKSLTVQNSPADPLTLANGFIASPTITPDTFAIDPNFQVGYAQNWQASVQRDLPHALVITGTYLGIKGTRGVQEFLPNTYPIGAVNPCPACPAGFTYMASNGNSTREAGRIELRRRLSTGLAGTLQYTYSKSIDDSALGGRGQGTAVIAQNWLDLSAERGLSNFDQRHLLSAQMQFATGEGIGGGTLISGWKGALFKEWLLTSQITASSGLPLTPIYFAAVNGTGVTGPIRAEYTGASVYAAPPGLFLNPAAYAPPPLGQWGNAGRDTIIGPTQFSMNGYLGRTFRPNDRLSVDWILQSTNVLNHVTYSSWITTITSAQFGLPTAANAMRSVQMTVRVRF